MSVPKACLAASASSSPAASIGPELVSWMLGVSESDLTRENDELASVFVIESMLAFTRKNMGNDESNVLGR